MPDTVLDTDYVTGNKVALPSSNLMGDRDKMQSNLSSGTIPLSTKLFTVKMSRWSNKTSALDSLPTDLAC